MDRRPLPRLIGRFAPVLLVALSLGCDMDPNGRYLVMIAALFLLGAVGEVVFEKTQIPDVVWLILAGVVLNVTGLVDPSSLDPIMPLFSALTLIIVLFDGGRQIVIHDLIKAAPRASAMAGLSFTLAVLGVAVVLQLAALTGLLPESWTFMHSLMVGAMVGGSSSLIIMPSMSLAKVEPKVSNLVGLESALTDALCVVVAVVLMNVIKSGEASGTDAVLELGENFGLALFIGLIAGWVWMPVLRALSGNPYAYPITLAALMILYVVVDNVGGNPAMAVLTFSVIVGNAEALMKMVGFQLGDKPLALDETVVTVHTQAAFIIKSFFFTYIGLMLSRPVYLLLLGFVVGLSLFVTRIPAVMLVCRAGFDDSQRKMISISLPRGMAAGVLATLPASAKYKIAGTEDLPSMVFASVVTSIAIFAYGFRKVRGEAAAAGPGAVEAAGEAIEGAVDPGQAAEAPAIAEAPESASPASEAGAESPPPTEGPAADAAALGPTDSSSAPSPASRSGTAYGIAPPPSPGEPATTPTPTPPIPSSPNATLQGIPAQAIVPGLPDAPPAAPGAPAAPATPDAPAAPAASGAPVPVAPAAPEPPGEPGETPSAEQRVRVATPKWHPPQEPIKKD